jgi:PilZ domain
VLNDLSVPGSLLFDFEPSTETRGANGRAPAPHVPARAHQVDDAPGLLVHSRRRREPRYRAIEDRVWVEWWCDGEFNGLSGRMVNVSRSGALIVIGARLNDDQVLSMILEECVAEVAIEATVRGTTPLRGGVFQTRLEFLSPCPEAFFAVAASGFEAWLTGRRQG